MGSSHGLFGSGGVSSLAAGPGFSTSGPDCGDTGGSSGFVPGEEDGVDHSDQPREKLYTSPEDMLAVHEALNGLGRYMFAATFGNECGVGVVMPGSNWKDFVSPVFGLTITLTLPGRSPLRKSNPPNASWFALLVMSRS